MQLVVLGMHRSGTSLVTSALARMGCFVGPQTTAVGPWNPRGHWEHPDVVALDEEILAALGATWFDVGALDLGALGREDRARLEERAAAVVAALDPHRPWAIKDPRLCSLFPFWRPLLECPVVVFVHRDPIAVAHSLRARDGFPLVFGLALWEASVRSALAASASVPRLSISHRAFLRDPVAAARALREGLAKLGVDALAEPEEAGVANLLEAGLHHHEPDAALRGELLTPAQLELCLALERDDLPEAQVKRSEGAEDLLRTYPAQLRRLEVAQAERDLLRAHQQIEPELRRWVAELEEAKAWLEQQRADWQATAEAEARLNEELREQISRASADRER